MTIPSGYPCFLFAVVHLVRGFYSTLGRANSFGRFVFHETQANKRAPVACGTYQCVVASILHPAARHGVSVGVGVGIGVDCFLVVIISWCNRRDLFVWCAPCTFYFDQLSFSCFFTCACRRDMTRRVEYASLQRGCRADDRLGRKVLRLVRNTGKKKAGGGGDGRLLWLRSGSSG